MLKQLMEKNVDSSSNVDHVNIAELVKDVIELKCATLLPLPNFKYETPIYLDINADKLSNILYNLISNAQQASDDEGNVDIQVSENDDTVIIDIMDDGCGMSENFIDNGLFTPFITTKGNAGMGVGAYDAKSFIESLGGSLIVKSKEGDGSLFKLTIPKIQD